EILAHAPRDRHVRKVRLDAGGDDRLARARVEERADLVQVLALERAADAVDQVRERAGVVRIEREAAGGQRREAETVGLRAAQLVGREVDAGARDVLHLLLLVDADLRVADGAFGVGAGHAGVEAGVRRAIVGVAAGRGIRVARRSEDAGVALDLALGDREAAIERRADHALGVLGALLREAALAFRDVVDVGDDL